MSRASFFSNVSSNDFTADVSSNTANPSLGNTSATSASQVLGSTATTNNDNIKRNKRIAYTIKIDPAIRKNIKDWAIKNDVTISSVIEALARSYLKDLKKEDIHV